MDVPWRRDFDAARDPYTARNALGITSLGGGAPATAEYITASADPTLTNERVLTNTATITWDFSTPGQAKASTTSGGGTATVAAPQGRLTLQAATPVMTTTQAAKTTIYYTPYVGNMLPIYDGTSTAMVTFSQLSALTTDTTKSPAAIGANKVNDWFVWDDAGTLRLSHGPDWTNDTTRSVGAALIFINGFWVNSPAITNGPNSWRGTYVGTTRSNASSQLDWIYGGFSAGGTAGWFGVWNAYNRVQVSTAVIDTTMSRTIAPNVTEPLFNSTNNRVSYIAGLEEDAFGAVVRASGAAGSGGWIAVGVGYDAIAITSGVIQSGHQHTSVLAINGSFATTSLGWHFMQALEMTLNVAGSIYSSGIAALLRSGMEWSGKM